MNYYDQISESYEELHKEEQFRKLKLIKEGLDLGGDELILDVGCGPCWSAEFFENVVGVDPSAELLKKCPESVEAVEGRAEELPFEDDEFDVVICVTVIHHCDVDKALEEMRRVGKPNANIVITVLKKSGRKDLIVSKVKEKLNVVKEMEEDKDIILFCRNGIS